MLPLRQNNPLAPAAYNGLTEIGATYEYDDIVKGATFALNANAVSLNNLVPLDRDGDFLLTCVYILSVGNVGFGIRFGDQFGYYINDNFMSNEFLSTAATGVGIPFVFGIPMYYPSGSSILVDLAEYSGNTYNVTFFFRGWKVRGQMQ